MSKAISKITKPISSVFGSIFGAPDTPDLPKEEVMPLADEAALSAARKRQAATKSGGRASTVLSMGSGTGKSKLGN